MPRVLEHMVGTVLYFEGDRYASYRILRGVKNRFGSTNEIGVFEMRGSGLAEVTNPSEYMLEGKPEGASGSIVACTMEGTRPVLLEVQALVCQSIWHFRAGQRRDRSEPGESSVGSARKACRSAPVLVMPISTSQAVSE